MTIAERERQTEERINNEIDSCGLAYKVKDTEGNIFVFGGIATGGFPWYRGRGGSKHIFNLLGYEIIEKHIKM